jgi:hypothetical protein
VLGIAYVVLVVIAAVRANNGQHYRYPDHPLRNVGYQQSRPASQSCSTAMSDGRGDDRLVIPLVIPLVVTAWNGT